MKKPSIQTVKADPEHEERKGKEGGGDQNQVDDQRAQPQSRTRDPKLQVDALRRDELADLLRLRVAGLGVGRGAHATSSRRGT
jgi:hypothetical protein